MTTLQLILFLSNLPALVVAVYAARNYRKFERELRVFSGFLFVNALIQLGSSGVSLLNKNNLPFLHLYTLCTGVSVLLFYHLILRKYISSAFLAWMAAGYGLFSLQDSIFWESIFTFNSLSLTVLSVLIIILTLSTFNLFLIDSVKAEHRARISGLSWINTGLFIYFSTNLILYYFGDLIMSALFPPEMTRLVWVLHVFFMTIMHFCFFIGLWKSPKR